MKLAIGLLAAAALAQDPIGTLEQARDKVLAESPNSRKYVCVETIDRSYYSRRGILAAAPSCERLVLDHQNAKERLQLDRTDRVRVAVAIAGGREVYSWTGTPPVAHRVEEIVNAGPFGTGAYAGHLLDIFSDPGVRFRLLDDRGKAPSYGFRVPVEASHLLVLGKSDWLPSGYSGSLRIDPETLDVRRLEVETDELPRESSACEETTVLDFRSRQDGGIGWFLPSESRSRDILTDGSVTERVTTLADCREGGADSQAAPPYPGAPVEPGVRLTIQLDPIDLNEAAAGDPISGTVVATPGISIDGKVQLPSKLEGAKVTGRITGMVHQLRPQTGFYLSFFFDTLIQKGVSSPFYADSVSRRSRGENTPPLTFVFERPAIPPGFKTVWVTLLPTPLAVH